MADPKKPETAAPETALALRPAVAPSPYEPRDFAEAMAMAKVFAAATGITQEVAFLKMAAAREYAIGAVASLRQIDVIKLGDVLQVAPRAQLLMGLCQRAVSIVEYFEFVSGDATQATHRTRRFGRDEITETYTIDQARKAGLIKPGGAWEKDPASQLIARSSSRLARKAHPDICGNMYAAEELSESGGDPTKTTIAAAVTPIPKPAEAQATATAAPRGTDDEEIRDWTAAAMLATGPAAGDKFIVALKAAHADKDSPVRVALRKVIDGRVAAKWAPVPTVHHDPETGEVITTEREAGSDG